MEFKVGTETEQEHTLVLVLLTIQPTLTWALLEFTLLNGTYSPLPLHMLISISMQYNTLVWGSTVAKRNQYPISMFTQNPSTVPVP